jgi:hypothetical protein
VADQAADQAGGVDQGRELQRLELGALEAADDDVAVADRGAGVPARADVEAVGDVDLEDDRLDEDLAARDVELADHVAQGEEVAARGDHHQGVGRGVVGDADLALEGGALERTAAGGGRARRRRGGPALLRVAPRRLGGAADRGVEGGRQLLGVGVLELIDVDRAGALAVERDVEPLHQRADPQVAGLAGHHDERVGPLVGHDLRRQRRLDVGLAGGRRRRPRRIGGRRLGATTAGGRRGRTRRRGAGLQAEDVVERGDQLLGLGVDDLDRVDLLVRRRLIDLARQRDHVAHVRREVGDDQDAALADRLDVTRRRLHDLQRVGHVVGVTLVGRMTRRTISSVLPGVPRL